MSGLSALLSLDSAKLDAKIDLASSSGSLSVSVGSPLELLGNGGKAIQSIKELGSAGGSGAFAGALQELGSIAPFGDIPAIGEVADIFSTLQAKLEPLKDLIELDSRALVDRILSDFGGVEGIAQRLTTELTGALTAEPPEEIALPLRALSDLAKGPPASARDAAAFFVRFLLGLDLAALRAPFELLEAARVQLAGEASLTALKTRIAALTAEVDLTADALVSVDPDFSALMEQVTRIRTELDLLIDIALPGAMEHFAADIAAIDARGLALKLDKALEPLLARVPVPPRGLGGFFLPALRSVGEGFDQLDPAALIAYLDELEQEVRAKFASSDIGRLRDDARALLAGIVGFLESVPLESLRAELTKALAEIEIRVSSLADFSPVGDLGERTEALTSAIEGVDLGAVTSTVTKLADEIRGLADRFPIDEVKAELESLLGAAEAAVAELPPMIDALKGKIDELASQLTSIKLTVAGDASVKGVSDLRADVREAISGADLPDALKVPLGLLAGEVRKIDLAASVSGQLDAIVGKVDLSGIMAPIQGALDRARSALASLSPTQLAARLDEPFDAALNELHRFSPAALVDQLSTEFRQATDELDRVSPEALVQPLQHAFDELLAKLRKAADPAPLLAPLKKAYAELQAVVEIIDPTQLIGNAVVEASRLPGVLTQATGDALNSAIHGGSALPEGGSAEISFGAIVRPLAGFVNEARSVVKSAAGDLLGEALELVSRPLALLVEAGEAAGGHLGELAAAIEERRALVDPASTTGPLADLRSALARLQRTEAALAASGRSNAAFGATVGGLRFEAFVTISFPARRDLDDAVAELGAGLDEPDLGASLHRLGQVLRDLVPPALLAPSSEAVVMAKIDAIFDAVDPKPIADELDAIGAKILAKLQSFAEDIARQLFKVWNAIFEEMEPVTPGGLLKTLTEVMDAIKAQLAALDPAQLEAEINEIVEALIAALEAYSPAAFAGTLTPAFEALKAKLAALDPAALLGDLSPLSSALDEVEKLRPSLVLAPLTAQAEAIDKSLQSLLGFDPAAIITAAIANLKAEIELVLQRIEVELDGLLGDLEGAGGGSASVSASVG
jgi:hypothetical protein